MPVSSKRCLLPYTGLCDVQRAQPLQTTVAWHWACTWGRLPGNRIEKNPQGRFEAFSILEAVLLWSYRYARSGCALAVNVHCRQGRK